MPDTPDDLAALIPEPIPDHTDEDYDDPNYDEALAHVDPDSPEAVVHLPKGWGDE